jgi:transcriptional regulator with XRE-family HTH domain
MSTKLAELRALGLEQKGFREGYDARDALIRFGAMLRRVRESAGLTQEDLAKRVGMTQPAVSRLETGLGSHGPEIDTVMRFVHGCQAELVVSVKSRGTQEDEQLVASALTTFETAM